MAARATSTRRSWRCRMFGGSVLGRPIEILQADEQNKPDVASAIARQWIDDTGVDALGDGSATSSGLAVQQIAREKKKIYLINDPAATDFIGKQCSPWSFQFVLRHLHTGQRHRRRADQGGRRHLVLHHRRLCVRLLVAEQHRGLHQRGRRQGAGQRARPARHLGLLHLPAAGQGVRCQGDRLRQRRHRPAELPEAGGRVPA